MELWGRISMNKCKTCKWWFIFSENTAQCDKISIEYGASNTNMIEIDYPSDHVPVITNENFGCVLWEKKDGEV